jgi:hypothetical protein
MLGASLALGFAFMVIVEKMSGGHGHAHATAAPPASDNGSSSTQR